MRRSARIRWLLRALGRYQRRWPAEAAVVGRFLRLLDEAGDRALERSHLPGHLTASAWIVDPAAGHCVLLHHRKLGKWLQPGGHADGEADLLAVALREVREETGLGTVRAHSGREEPLDLDVHAIPAAGSEPPHLHFDVRYLVEASAASPLRVNSESRAVRWVPIPSLGRYTSEPSLTRMARKASETLGSKGPGGLPRAFAGAPDRASAGPGADADLEKGAPAAEEETGGDTGSRRGTSGPPEAPLGET